MGSISGIFRLVFSAAALALVLAACPAAAAPGQALAARGEVVLVFNSAAGTRVVNAEGKVLEVGRDMRLHGDMNRIDECKSRFGNPYLTWSVSVPESASYTFTSPHDDARFESVSNSGAGSGVVVEGESGQIVLSRRGDSWLASVSGSTGKLHMSACHEKGCLVTVDSKSDGMSSLTANRSDAVIRGVLGVANVRTSLVAGTGDIVETRWWFPSAAKEYRIACAKGSVRVPGAFRVKGLVRGHVTGLVAHAAGDGRAFLTWNKVRKARSYRVFRLDPKTGRWVHVAHRRGRAGNWCALPGTGRPYDVFRVRAYADRAGKRPACRTSYWVSAAYGEAYSNATGLSGPPRSLSLEAGSSRALKASPVHGAAPLLSRKVRWYTSDPRVAIVDRRGRVTAVGPGRCKVWAKAHDGANSRRVRVTVR